MIEITHPKVASLKPEWALFGGCTIIFERFGRVGGGEGDAHRLHGALADALALVPPADWRALGFCPLPVESLHVTLADLLHQGNLKTMPDGVRGRVTDPAGRIDPALAVAAVTDLVEASGILALNASALRFRLDRIAVRKGRVIVAELSPDPASGSAAAFARMMTARDALNAALLAEFGVPVEPYAPHVTLGYLANRDLAKRAAPLAERIDDLIDQTSRPLSFAYGQPRLYTFADMARFDPVED